jgi:class I fructose-bisphosphate aldolase
MILKLNNSDSLAKVEQPCSAITGSVKDALRLGCTAIGYTIYPGSGARNRQYEDLRELILEAKTSGLPTVLWAYPRGAAISKDGETAIDVCAYAAQISAQMGAHVIKIKPPKDFIEQAEAKKAFEKAAIPTKTLSDRVRHCVQSAFNGKRIVIFSGGEAKGTDDVLAEVKEIAAGGGFGSIMGRNAFQRPRDEALKLLASVQKIFKDAH